MSVRDKAEAALKAVMLEHAKIGLAWVRGQRGEISEEACSSEMQKRLNNLPKLEFVLSTFENQLWGVEKEAK